MGNCLVHLTKTLGVHNDSKYTFDPENHITVEPATTVEMTEINQMTDEIELGQRTSLENMNCTNIDQVILEPKEQKDIANMNIKMKTAADKDLEASDDDDDDGHDNYSFKDDYDNDSVLEK